MTLVIGEESERVEVRPAQAGKPAADSPNQSSRPAWIARRGPWTWRAFTAMRQFKIFPPGDEDHVGAHGRQIASRLVSAVTKIWLGEQRCLAGG
jgi:hypothetical protein